MAQTPEDYDPELTEQLLEEGDRRLEESRRLLADLDSRIDGDGTV